MKHELGVRVWLPLSHLSLVNSFLINPNQGAMHSSQDLSPYFLPRESTRFLLCRKCMSQTSFVVYNSYTTSTTLTSLGCACALHSRLCFLLTMWLCCSSTIHNHIRITKTYDPWMTLTPFCITPLITIALL